VRLQVFYSFLKKRKNFWFSLSTVERNYNPSHLILEWALLQVPLGFTTMITVENRMHTCNLSAFGSML
jgi:hypothetical protein